MERETVQVAVGSRYWPASGSGRSPGRAYSGDQQAKA